MKLNVSEFAKITGVSVRTLRYYDEIGLLKPDIVDGGNGYRYYCESALGRMQEILFYRELDFELSEIAKIISSPDYDKKEALRSQKELLILKKQRLERIIESLESAERGEGIVSFEVFGEGEVNSYKEEVKARWGETAAYKEQTEKTAEYTENAWKTFGRELNEIIKGFAEIKATGEAAESKRAQEQVKRLQDFITKTQYTCTKEILASLGEMYVADERFRKNIDKAGIGTARFISTAVKKYCE